MESWRESVHAVVAGTKVPVADAIAHSKRRSRRVRRPRMRLISHWRSVRDPVALCSVRGACRWLQGTRVRLVVEHRLASYRGAGPLRAWAAIAAQRIALNARRDARAGAALPSAPGRDDVLAEELSQLFVMSI